MEFHKKNAIYLQIADLMCERILRGTWPENERIPSVRELAVTLEVNPNTVMRTYAYLQENEIIFNKRGIGYFVAEDGRQATRRLLKSNFVRNELPRVFNTLELLGLDFEELYALFQAYQEENK